jgi:hypothetical protein
LPSCFRKEKKEDEEADLISCKFPKTQEKKCDGEAATPINKKLNCFSYYPNTILKLPRPSIKN